MRLLVLSLDQIPDRWWSSSTSSGPSPLRCWSDLAAVAEIVVLTQADPAAAAARLRIRGLDIGPERIVQPGQLPQVYQRLWRAPTPPPIIYLASADSHELEWAASGAATPGRWVPVGLTGSIAATSRLEAAGAWFVARDARELIALASAPTCDATLSVIVMAFNERATVGAAVHEIRRFCQLHLRDYEIVVVDDGSRDGTDAVAERQNRGDVVVIRHSRNAGMGAAMRSGYRAARKEYLVALPADRQIRAQQLSALLPFLGADTCVHGFYRIPHAGPLRAAMSAGFRLLLQRVGALRVDFDGAYVFGRQWLQQLDLNALYSESFVFSFELLEQLRRRGCRFHGVEMQAFGREAGRSRVARPGRIARVFAEVVQVRARRGLQRLTARS